MMKSLNVPFFSKEILSDLIDDSRCLLTGDMDLGCSQHHLVYQFDDIVSGLHVHANFVDFSSF